MGVWASSTLSDLLKQLAEYGKASNKLARALPAAFYTREDFLLLECEQLFRKEWVCLGHAGEIPKRGNFFTTELVGEQILVLRDNRGAVRVLSNVCRHRGHPVAEGKGTKRVFVCPYHAWSYGLDGALKNAPYFEKCAGFDKKTVRLPEFKSEIWNSFIFVNLDGEATALAPRIENLAPSIRNYHIEERSFLDGQEETWATNWKCLTENFMEGYHLSITHAKTLHHITPTALCRKIPGGEGYTAYASGYDASFPQRAPFHPDLREEEQRQSLLFCIYPSFVMTSAPNFSLYMCLRPKAVDAVALRWGMIGHTDDLQDPAAKEYLETAHAFNAEDRAKLEALQRGLQTRYYEPGPLAPDDLEGTVQDFHRYLAKSLAC